MSEKKYFLQGKTRGNDPLIIPLDKPETLIGRSKECDLILQAPSVSRKHAVIKVFGDDVYLKDLGSRNGCYINGVKTRDEEILRSADIIRIGAMEFIFQDEECEIEEDDSEKTLIDVKKQQESDFVKQYALSTREEEVLYLLLKGLKVKEISDKLFISQGTAKNHVLSIYSKTDCHSRIELSHKYQEFN